MAWFGRTYFADRVNYCDLVRYLYINGKQVKGIESSDGTELEYVHNCSGSTVQLHLGKRMLDMYVFSDTRENAYKELRALEKILMGEKNPAVPA